MLLFMSPVTLIESSLFECSEPMLTSIPRALSVGWPRTAPVLMMAPLSSMLLLTEPTFVSSAEDEKEAKNNTKNEMAVL